MLSELIPIYANQKSFYDKALVDDCEGLTLLSYSTEIIKVFAGDLYLLAPLEKLSMTTLKHLKEFAIQTIGIAINKNIYRKLLDQYGLETPINISYLNNEYGRIPLKY